MTDLVQYCHGCERIVAEALDESVDPVCPNCGDSFIELVPRPAGHNPTHPLASMLEGLMQAPVRIDIQNISMPDMLFRVAGPMLQQMGLNAEVFTVENHNESFEDILERLRDSEPARGPPPTPDHVIDGLTSVPVSSEDMVLCAVCLEELVGLAKLMPCSHRFHAQCLIPWLKQHNSCPVCRAPL